LCVYCVPYSGILAANYKKRFVAFYTHRGRPKVGKYRLADKLHLAENPHSELAAILYE